MGFLFALVYDPFMRRTEEACLAAHRRDVLAGAKGEVLEIGAGTGANLAHYPDAVERLVLTEPDAHMRARLERAVLASPPHAARVEAVGAPASALPYADATFDTVVSTLVLCTVPEPARVLAELHRVLRPGGRLLFLEHVAADEHTSTFRWQKRVEPIWSVLAEGCHTTRRTGLAIREAGFVMEREERGRMRKAVRWVEPLIYGAARKEG